MPCMDGECACRTLDQTCWRDSECCNGLGCVAGGCQDVSDCRRPGDASVMCTVRADCCQNLDCLLPTFGATMTECCAGGGSPCETDRDCCGAMACEMGECACHGLGDDCANDTDCCGLAFCTDGTCVDR